jgi:hypothetical protein
MGEYLQGNVFCRNAIAVSAVLVVCLDDEDEACKCEAEGYEGNDDMEAKEVR